MEADAPFPVYTTEDERFLRLTGGGYACELNGSKAIVLHKKLLGKGNAFTGALLWHEVGHLALGHKASSNPFRDCLNEAEADSVAASKVGLWPIVFLVATLLIWSIKTYSSQSLDFIANITKNNFAIGICTAAITGPEIAIRSAFTTAIIACRLGTLLVLLALKRIKG
jgi:hypothetical protein